MYFYAARHRRRHCRCSCESRGPSTPRDRNSCRRWWQRRGITVARFGAGDTGRRRPLFCNGFPSGVSPAGEMEKKFVLFFFFFFTTPSFATPSPSSVSIRTIFLRETGRMIRAYFTDVYTYVHSILSSLSVSTKYV